MTGQTVTAGKGLGECVKAIKVEDRLRLQKRELTVVEPEVVAEAEIPVAVITNKMYTRRLNLNMSKTTHHSP